VVVSARKITIFLVFVDKKKREELHKSHRIQNLSNAPSIVGRYKNVLTSK